MIRGLTELDVEFEIATDLCREKSHEYDAKKRNRKTLNIDEVIGHFGMSISEKIRLQLIV